MMTPSSQAKLRVTCYADVHNVIVSSCGVCNVRFVAVLLLMCTDFDCCGRGR